MEEEERRAMTERFSEREKIVTPVIQTNGMDDALRNSIWNFIWHVLPPEHYQYVKLQSDVVRAIAEHVLRIPIDGVPDQGARSWLLNKFHKLEWHVVYDLLDFVVINARQLSVGTTPEAAAQAANLVLAREHSGFRFVAGRLTRNIHPTEVAAIESAVAAAGSKGLDGVRAHIQQALTLFGQRPVPDYRNAVKEAISAVESAAKVITGDEKATLDDALKALGKSSAIHGAMVEAFRKLYGYTSDEKGIRHALLDETARVEAEDAQFMIVACSAFVHLLIAKADKAGLLKPR